MAAIDAETLGFGLGLVLEFPSQIPSSNTTDSNETLNGNLQNLKLVDNPESKTNELENPKIEEKSEEKSNGGDHYLTAAEESENSADGKLEPLSEEKIGENQKLDEVKGDDWGWDQDFNESSGNQKDFEWSNKEKVEAFGWGPETGGSVDNLKPRKGFKSLKEEKGQRMKSQLPVRSIEENCTYYMKTGTCKFGLNCKFNHPPNKMKTKVKVRKMPEGVQAAGLKENGASPEIVGKTEYEKTCKEKKVGTLSDSNGQISCKYYSSPAGCKYDNACKYNHNEKTEVPVAPAALNFLGLPMRPGEQECTYYMSTGSCKYSTNCRFHHPDPIAVGGQGPSSGYQNCAPPQPHAPPAQLPMTSWPVQRTPNDQVSFLNTLPPYVTGFYLPPHGIHPSPEWNSYPAPVSPLYPAEMNMPHPPSVATMKDTMHKGNGSAPIKAADGEYPERPGQQECQFFMKTGICKFKTACKFHHPKSRLPKTSGVNVSPVGLPIRPDQPICTHYNRHQICKYGLSCKYSHPMDFNLSVAPASTPDFQKVFPVPCVEPQEVKTEGNTNTNQESEW